MIVMTMSHKIFIKYSFVADPLMTSEDVFSMFYETKKKTMNKF